MGLLATLVLDAVDTVLAETARSVKSAAWREAYAWLGSDDDALFTFRWAALTMGLEPEPIRTLVRARVLSFAPSTQRTGRGQRQVWRGRRRVVAVAA